MGSSMDAGILRLLRAFLNFFAGLFYVLAEAMGRFAPDTDDSQERGDEQ